MFENSNVQNKRLNLLMKGLKEFKEKVCSYLY